MSATGYRELFERPAIRWQAVAGLAAQLIQGAVSAGVILVVRQHGGSLALGGAVAAGFWIASGIARPFQGRVIDRRGAGSLLVGCAVINGGALAGVVGVSALHAPGVLLILLGIVAGLALAPISASMRVGWAAAGDHGERTAAYSLVYLIQELAMLTGPVLLAVLVAAGSPSLALIGVAAIASAGTVAYALAVRGVPSPRGHGGGEPVARNRRLWLLTLVSVLTGAVVGGIQVGAPAFATSHHDPAAAGVLVAAVSIGGIIGATVYGGARWRADASVRLLALGSLMTGALALVLIARGLVVLGALLVLVGLPLNPLLATLSLLVDRHVHTGAAAEAFGYLSTGLAGGTGLASVIAATLAQQANSPRVAFAVAGVAGLLATVVAAAAMRSLRAP